ncbi:hypothetical protein GGR51DRAFT_560522 [Nemania sp. FL0031]|nr:hypothetical protein GGR51DRAFT_560522 [Nemania sp. FL0031]
MFTKAFVAYNVLATVSAGAVLHRQLGTHEAYRFRLVANVVGADLVPSVQGNGVIANPYGCAGPLNIATDIGGTPWYFNSTANGLLVPGHWGGYETFSGVVVTPGGSATMPSKNRLEVGCNQTTTGLGFVVDPDNTVPHLVYGDGAWMACPGEVLGDDYSIRVSYKKAGQSTLEGCADIELWPVCADDVEAEPFEGARTMTCLSDWTWG